MKIYVDVTVARPTRASTLNSQSELNRALAEPLLTLRRASSVKKNRYAAIVAANNYQFFTFGMETYGGIGSEAMNLLKLLARHSEAMPSASFMSWACRRLSVCLQTCNANLSLLAAQRMSTARLMHKDTVQPTLTFPRVVPLNTQQLNERALAAMQAVTYSQLDKQQQKRASKKRVSFAHDVGMGRSDVSREVTVTPPPTQTASRPLTHTSSHDETESESSDDESVQIIGFQHIPTLPQQKTHSHTHRSSLRLLAQRMRQAGLVLASEFRNTRSCTLQVTINNIPTP